jgi:hypothetical protein
MQRLAGGVPNCYYGPPLSTAPIYAEFGADGELLTGQAGIALQGGVGGQLGRAQGLSSRA